MIVHPFPPVCDEKSKILILGSFPSVKSRQAMFYYGNPRNRFWKVISAVFGNDVPSDTEGRISYLKEHGIALWDVIYSCDISGSSDASIKNVTVNDVCSLPCFSSSLRIFTNGNTAYSIYKKYMFQNTGIEAVKLPSTSPANACLSLDDLVSAWKDAFITDQ